MERKDPLTMPEQPKELQSLLETAKHLSEIQDRFDVYQKACFTERPPEFFALELNGEAGELANLEKKSWKGKAVEHTRFDDEAADVFIALMNYCNARGVELGAAVGEKLEEIERRRSTGTH
jgi:NTP pyrophosphatase (non-canonical NTP hydrolase)